MRAHRSFIPGLFLLCGALNAAPVTSPLQDVEVAIRERRFEPAAGQLNGLIAAARPGTPEADQTAQLMLQLLHVRGDDAAIPAFIKSHREWVKLSADPGAFEYWSAVAAGAGDPQAALSILKDFDRRYKDSPHAPRAARLRARYLLQTGQGGPAVQELESFATRYPGSPDHAAVQVDLGRALASLDRMDDARRVLGRVIADTYTPAAQEARLLLAQWHLNVGDTPACISVLEPLANDEAALPDMRALAYSRLSTLWGTNQPVTMLHLSNAISLATSPDLRRTLELRLGKTMILGGAITNGVACIKAAITLNPLDTWSASAQVQLADVLFLKGQYREALSEYQSYLDTFGNERTRAAAYDGRGWTLSRLGLHAEAAASFSKAMELHRVPTFRAQSAFKVGDCYFANGQHRLAADAYRQFLLLFPTSPLRARATFQLAEALARTGENTQAEATMSELAARHPDDPLAEEALLRVAEMQAERGQWDAAMEGFSRVMATHRNGALTADALTGRGLTEYRLGLYPQALHDFEAVIDRHPETLAGEQASYMRALCLYRLGFDADAVMACHNFIEHFPQSRWVREARFWLGEHEFNNGLYPVAESNFIAFARAYPTDAIADQALLLAGLSAVRQNNFVRAAELLGLMARTYPESPHLDEARFIQADALCTLGDFGAAIVILDEIINKYANGAWTPAAWCRKGDCQFALAPDDPTRYQKALDAYGITASHASASLDLQVQAGYKAGKCLERIGRTDEALSQYYAGVMVRYFEAAGRGTPVSPGMDVWVSRATFDAAELLEARQDWAGVLELMQRLVDTRLPGAKQAQDRIDQIKTRRKEAR